MNVTFLRVDRDSLEIRCSLFGVHCSEQRAHTHTRHPESRTSRCARESRRRTLRVCTVSMNVTFLRVDRDSLEIRCSLFAVRRSLFRTASTHTHAYPSLPAPLGLRVGSQHRFGPVVRSSARDGRNRRWRAYTVLLFAVRRSLFRTASTHTHAYPSLPAPLGPCVGRFDQGPTSDAPSGRNGSGRAGAAAGEGVCVARAERVQSARLAV